MEEFRLSLHDFLAKIGAPRGLTIDFIDGNCRRKLELNEDLVVLVGPHSDKYTIPVASIREYYAIRDRPKEKAMESAPMAPEFKLDDPTPEKKPSRGR